jgi:hypothetical protein
MRLRRIKKKKKRMTKLSQPNVIPPSVPVQHNSGSIRTAPAGGKVSPDQYVGKVPAPARRLRQQLRGEGRRPDLRQTGRRKEALRKKSAEGSI